QDGQQIIRVCVGPIANSVADLGLAMEALCSPAMWAGDPSLPRIPWDKGTLREGNGRPLKVGYFLTDHWFKPCRTVTRAVKETVEGLLSAGHEVVHFEP
ncbi:unnamed protein product, partial [Choristocarpus tenellus]